LLLMRYSYVAHRCKSPIKTHLLRRLMHHRVTPRCSSRPRQVAQVVLLELRRQLPPLYPRVVVRAGVVQPMLGSRSGVDQEFALHEEQAASKYYEVVLEQWVAT
jgi:hypothetical protein